MTRAEPGLSRRNEEAFMRRFLILCGLSSGLVGAGCGGSSPARAETAASVRLERSRADGSKEPAADKTQAATESEIERELAKEARLETIERLALARNPDLEEAGERVKAARERAPSLSRLPDPEFEYQLSGQPITEQVNFGATQLHLFPIRQGPRVRASR